VTRRAVSDSRRHLFPPLWLVPLLLIAAIVVIAYASVTLGVLGLVAGLYAVYWLQRKADAYVRDRDSSSD
jgi:hypothetical protein